tara:strand:- start:106 stop:351 length:246 start_codon:yes stop_codon:yes gene_type:complete
MMAFWDPYFGWDYHAIGQVVFALAAVTAFLALFGATEHGDALYLFANVATWLTTHSALVIGAFIFALVGGFYFWRLQNGDF